LIHHKAKAAEFTVRPATLAHLRSLCILFAKQVVAIQACASCAPALPTSRSGLFCLCCLVEFYTCGSVSPPKLSLVPIHIHYFCMFPAIQCPCYCACLSYATFSLSFLASLLSDPMPIGISILAVLNMLWFCPGVSFCCCPCFRLYIMMTLLPFVHFPDGHSGH
jgi:hypothetical protein